MVLWPYASGAASSRWTRPSRPKGAEGPAPEGTGPGSTFVKMVETVGIEPTQRSRREQD